MAAREARRRRMGLVVSGVTLLLLLVAGLVGEAVVRRLRPGQGEAEERYWSHLLEQLAPCEAARKAGAKAPGVTRVAVIGESSSQYLGHHMRELADGSKVPLEVIPCGLSAASVEQVAGQLADVRAVRPDVVVVVTGHNLGMRYPTDVSQVRFQALLSKSRLLGLLAGPLRPSPWGFGVGRVEERLPVLEAFLRDAAAASKADGFRLVVSTVTPNFWLPPFTNPRDAHPAADDPRLFEARWLRATGDATQALEKLGALASASADGNLAYEWGEWLAAAGDRARAREAFERAVALGTNRVIAPTNALVRRVAAETGALLRDTLADREEAASDGIPGWESLADNCHLYQPLFQREALAVLRMLLGDAAADTLGAEAEAAHRLEPLDQAGTVVPYHLEALRRAERPGGFSFQGTSSPDYVLRSLSSAFARLLHELGPDGPGRLDRALEKGLAEGELTATHRAGVALALAEAEWKAGLHARARTHLAQARGLEKTAADAVLEGLWDASEGHLDLAAAAFTAALALEPRSSEARSYLERAR